MSVAWRLDLLATSRNGTNVPETLSASWVPFPINCCKLLYSTTCK